MNLVQFIKHLGETALSLKNVNSFTNADVYITYNQPDIRYSNISFSHTSATISQGILTLSGVLTYADKMMENRVNLTAIQSDGIMQLNLLLEKLDDEISYSEVQFQFFEQSFADKLAGVYAQVTFEMPYNVCEELVEPEPVVMYIDKNGNYDVSVVDIVEVAVDTKEGLYNELVEQVEGKRQLLVTDPPYILQIKQQHGVPLGFEVDTSQYNQILYRANDTLGWNDVIIRRERTNNDILVRYCTQEWYDAQETHESGFVYVIVDENNQLSKIIINEDVKYTRNN